MIKTVFINLGSLFVFFLLSCIFFNVPQEIGNLLLFEVILLWLCNEAWYWLSASLIIFGGLFGELFRKTISDKGIKAFYHISSLVLLVLPPLLYALMYFADKLSNGGMQTYLGVPFSTSLFLCSYIGIIVLWLFSLFQTITPFSVDILFTKTFEPELFWKRIPEADASHDRNTSETISACPPSLPQQGVSETKADFGDEPPVSLQSSNLLPQHETMLKEAVTPDEEILYTGRPVLTIDNQYAKRDFIIGCCISPVVIISLLICIKSFLTNSADTAYTLACCMSGIFTILFGYVSFVCLMSPTHWKRKLGKVSYALTDKRIFIFENKSFTNYNFSDKLCIQTEMLGNNVGNIYLAKSGKLNSLLNGIFGKGKVQAVDTTVTVSLSKPMIHLFQVGEAGKILALIRECQQKAGVTP